MFVHVCVRARVCVKVGNNLETMIIIPWKLFNTGNMLSTRMIKKLKI